MLILLITPSAAGHHIEYKELLEKAFSELGHKVIHFSQKEEKLIKLDQPKSAFITKIKYVSKLYYKYQFFKTTIWKIRLNGLIKWQALFDHIDNLRKESIYPDLLFFEYIDSSIGQFITKWDINRKQSIHFSGILFHPEDVQLMPTRIPRRGPFDPYHLLKSKWCVSIGVLMQEAVPFMSRLIHKPVIEVPDVVSIPGVIQNISVGELIQNRAKDRFIIGIWGALEYRKGIREFLQMAMKLPSDQYLFVMGGQIDCNLLSAEDKQIFQQSTTGNLENLLIIDHWLTEDEFLSGIGSCDLIFAAYQDYRFTSGILGKTAAMGIPILVNDGYIMAKRVRDFKIGFVKKEQDDVTGWVTKNTTEIKEILHTSQFIEGCLRYCETYGYDNWRKSLAQLIEFNSSQEKTSNKK